MEQDKINNENVMEGTEKIDSSLYKFYFFLLEKGKKKKYRYVVDQLNKNTKLYSNYYWSYKLHTLKIKSMIKIINHKIKKYSKTLSPEKRVISKKNSLQGTRASSVGIIPGILPKKSINASFEVNASTINFSIEKWYTLISQEIDFLNENYLKDCFDLNIVEEIIQCYLLFLKTKSIYSQKLNEIAESFYYLCQAEQLIKNYLCLMKESRTIELTISIYLLIAKYLIENLNLPEAETYVRNVISLCQREYLLKCSNFSSLILENKNKIHLTKISIYLTTALLFYGYIKEYYGLIRVSVDAYQQAEFILTKLVPTDIPFFTTLVHRITKRSKMYLDSFCFFENEEKLLEEENQQIQKEIEAKNKQYKEFSNKKTNLKDFKEIENNVNQIVIPEIEGIDKNIRHIGSLKKKRILQEEKEKKEQDNSSPYRNEHIFYSDYLLSNMKLIDAYLSEDFKSLINSMSKINMTDLDYETKNVVQKMINKRHFKMEMEYYKKKNTLKKSSTSSTKGRNLNRASSSDFIHSSTTDNTNTVKKSKTFSNLKKKRNITVSENSKKIPKYKFAKKMFEYSKSFIQKINYLNKLNTREIKFHKDILFLKTKEKLLSAPLYSKERCEMEAEREFKQMKYMIKPQKETTKIMQLTLGEVKEKKRRASVENCLIKSLNNKAVEEFTNLQNNININKVKNLSFYEQLVKKNKEYDDSKLVNNNNNDLLKKISQEIGDLSEQERKINLKKYRKIKVLNKSQNHNINTSKNNTNHNLERYVKYNSLSDKINTNHKNKKTFSFFKMLTKTKKTVNSEIFVNINSESP